MKDKYDIDLGDDHFLQFTRWTCDRSLNPQYADLPDIDKCGAIIQHITPDGVNECSGSILFDSEVTRRLFGDHPRWTVKSFDPLTISPSVQCNCGDHGFIRDGKWVRV